MTLPPEVPSNDGVDGSHEPGALLHDEIERPSKRQRNFIARQVIYHRTAFSIVHCHFTKIRRGMSSLSCQKDEMR